MMNRVQDLFNLFQLNFVPDVGFGNGRFASSDWPANNRERGVIFDPFFESRNIVCSGLSKLCFPLREIFSVTQNRLPARGWKTPPKLSFFTGATVARPGILAGKSFSNALRKNNAYFEGKIAISKRKKNRSPQLFSEDETAKFRTTFVKSSAFLKAQFTKSGALTYLFPAKRDAYCGKQRTGLRPNSSLQRTSSVLGRPSERRA